MKINVIITGSTGMVGKGVLLECLDHENIASILIINRKPLGLKHSKLKELIHSDFQNFELIKTQLSGYDACFHCMGVSSVGLNEEEFSKLTYNISSKLADVLYELNPDLVFNYVSGTGTDNTELGNSMWARVKGKTENYILNKGFNATYMFRPGAIIPEKGVKSSTALYNIIYIILKPFFPLMKKMKSITTSSKLGLAMINSVTKGYDKIFLENEDINILASK